MAKKDAIKREQNGTGSDSAEREHARPQGKTEKKTQERTLEVSAQRMQEIMEGVAPVLDRLKTTTLEDIFAGQEIMLNGLRHLVKDNPKADPVALIGTIMQQLHMKALRELQPTPMAPVGEA